MLMERLLAAFNPRSLREAVTLLEHIRAHGVAVEDFINYMGERIAKENAAIVEMNRQSEIEMNRRSEIERRLPKCPTCGTPMVLREAHPPDRETGDPGDPGEGSHWTCPKCRFGRYDPRTIQEIRKSIEDDVGQ